VVCNCGASCKTSDTKEGEVFTCPKCGRREVNNRTLLRGIQEPRDLTTHELQALREDLQRSVTDFSARKESPPQAKPLVQIHEPIEMQETLDLFEKTVKNLLTMPPMPRKRRKQ
jgi:hypothetical protein